MELANLYNEDELASVKSSTELPTAEYDSLYGEILPSSLNTLLEHLSIEPSYTIVDAGMGVGRLLLQLVQNGPPAAYYIGVEYNRMRYNIARKALRRLYEEEVTKATRLAEGLRKIRMYLNGEEQRWVEMRRGDLLRQHDIHKADVIILNVKFPSNRYDDVAQLIRTLKRGAKICSYTKLETMHPSIALKTQCTGSVRLNTTWSKVFGHQFFLYSVL